MIDTPSSRLRPSIGMSCGPTGVCAVTRSSNAAGQGAIIEAAHEDGEHPSHLDDSNFRHQYDPNGPLGPTYWRIVRRGGELLCLSTVEVKRDAVVKAWGCAGLPYCDPQTGTAVVRIETLFGKGKQYAVKAGSLGFRALAERARESKIIDLNEKTYEENCN